MQTLSGKNFGILIAYLLPGFVALWGISYQSPVVKMWLVGNPPGYSVTIGGFLYTTLAAVIAGLICSTVRWLIIDTIHHKTGVSRPEWNYAQLQKNFDAYTLLEENHYRFYQFYSNTLIAFGFGYFGWRPNESGMLTGADSLFAILIALFFLGSRDTLRKYYLRVDALLNADESNTAR